MPYFEVMDQDGNKFNSLQLLGRKTIIYFYPKDNTSGCTAQACSLRDNYARLVAEGYNVIGISKDSVASHVKFAEKYNLNLEVNENSEEFIEIEFLHNEDIIPFYPFEDLIYFDVDYYTNETANGWCSSLLVRREHLIELCYQIGML